MGVSRNYLHPLYKNPDNHPGRFDNMIDKLWEVVHRMEEDALEMQVYLQEVQDERPRIQ